jgi:hypothetical protein
MNPAPVQDTADEVFLKGSQEYSQRVATFKIPPDEMKILVAREVGKAPETIPEPSCIVGRDYSWPLKKHPDSLDLWGPRLNGDTGEWRILRAEDYPFYVYEGSNVPRIIRLRISPYSFPEDWMKPLDKAAAAESDQQVAHGNGTARSRLFLATKDTDICTESDRTGRIVRISLFAHVDGELPGLVTEWAKGHDPHRHLLMMLWNVKIARKEVRMVRVFLNSPGASSQTSLDDPGYIETLDEFGEEVPDGSGRRWILRAAPTLRRQCKGGLFTLQNKITVQLVPIYKDNRFDSQAISVDGATLETDEY